MKNLLALFLLAACSLAIAHPEVRPADPPPPSTTHVPDNWGGWRAHIGVSAGIGALVYAAAPDAPWWAQTAVCLLPGHIRESRSRHHTGNRYSERDMFMNLVGCGVGLVGADHVRAHFAPGWVGLGIRF
jgi:hypothetical protein